MFLIKFTNSYVFPGGDLLHSGRVSLTTLCPAAAEANTGDEVECVLLPTLVSSERTGLMYVVETDTATPEGITRLYLKKSY